MANQNNRQPKYEIIGNCEKRRRRYQLKAITTPVLKSTKKNTVAINGQQ